MMRFLILLVTTSLWTKAVLASPNLAGPGLGGSGMPLLIVLGTLYVFIFYFVPIWLTYRAKKLCREKKTN